MWMSRWIPGNAFCPAKRPIVMSGRKAFRLREFFGLRFCSGFMNSMICALCTEREVPKGGAIRVPQGAFRHAG